MQAEGRGFAGRRIGGPGRMREKSTQQGERDPAAEAREDAVLVKRYLKGESEAFDEIVRRHHARLFGLVYHMTGHTHDTEDILQAVFLRALRALPRFRGKSSLSTWLHRIAVNTTINHIKRSKRGAASLDEPEHGVERMTEYLDEAARESPERDLALSELQQKLNAALKTLSDKHRAVVVLHDIEGVPHEEIARVMGCSVGTVRSRLFYARRLLQAELAEFAP